MAIAAGAPVHCLEVPTTGTPILVPSAVVAEVVNLSEITAMPLRPSWCFGVIGWRQRAVPLISIEELSGIGKGSIGPRSKVLVFFPIPGRPETNFFGILATNEPTPQLVTSEFKPASVPPGIRFMSTGITVKGNIALIPDLQALKQVFYPGT